MYFSPIVSLFLLSVLFNFCSAVKKAPQPVQCECESESPIVGNIVPVFVPTDKYSRLALHKIPQYVKILKRAEINAIIVNSVRTEALLGTQSEKLMLVKAWVNACKSEGLTVICQVGFTDFNDTLQLARYCRDVGAHGVIGEPEQYYTTNSIANVIDYFAEMAKACHPLPFMSYISEYQSRTTEYNSIEIVKQAREAIKNYAGIITSLDRCLAVQAATTLDSKLSIISTSEYDVSASPTFCLNGTSNVESNIFPKWNVEITRATLKGDVITATDLEKRKNRIIQKCLEPLYPDVINQSVLGSKIQLYRWMMKMIHGLDLGNLPIPPLVRLSRKVVLNCYTILRHEGIDARHPFDDEDESDESYRYPNEYKKNKYPTSNDDVNDNSDIEIYVN